MYHIEHDYTLASLIHEQRIREAEVDRGIGAIRSAKRALRSAASRVESMIGVQPAARRAA